MKLALVFVLILVTNVFAQEVQAPRVPNVHRIAKAWNSLSRETVLWNQAMARAEALLKARFVNDRVIYATEEKRLEVELDRRKACVGYYKAAREALLNQVEALNTLIEEEDY